MANQARTKRVSRTERIPFGVQRQKMTVDAETMARLKREDKVPRWINDTDNRLVGATQGGYEFVNDTGPTSVKVGDVEQERDRRIKKLVGTNKDGSPMVSYLMAIPKEYYDEDQAAKEKTNALVDASIRGGSPVGLNPHGVSADMGGVTVKSVDYRP